MDWSTVPPTYSLIGKDGRPRTGRRALDCLDQSRRRQLDPYTADPVLLFVTDPHTGRSASVFTLSRANAQRIAVVSTGVLLIVLAVTVLLGRRLVRPLKTLTEAAVTHSPAPVTTQDEIGYLASSLNEATRQRDNAEAQRRAMVSDVAHELRSPLTNMRSWLEAAQDDLADIDRPLVDLLHDETIVLQRILEDLTDLAAADAGTLRVHPEPVVLADCLDQVVSAHISAAEDAGVRLTGEVAGSVTLEADPVRLRQLVGNLVSNGLRNTPSGGSVTVAGRLVDGRVVITVRDTGAGIAPEHLPKIFERFWRADQSRTRATGGSGLGLPIVRQLVESHGGRVSVASAVGRGSVFTVELPASHG
jgi:two-component system sensor histidine kinase BaeS